MHRTGYATITYQFKLYTKNRDWFEKTKEYYNKILKFYYELLLDREELQFLSNQLLLCQLQILSLGEKKNHTIAIEPLIYKKVPLYFRRAAINAAISMLLLFIIRGCIENLQRNKYN